MAATANADRLAFFRRRKWLIALTALAVTAVAGAVAFLLPPTYESTATILIEEPEIPSDVVQATMFSFVDQRLQVINRRVMTTANLIELIRKYDLYNEDRAEIPLLALADRLRAALQMQTISADVTDPSTGRPTKATIAFSLSFRHRKPQTARSVLNDVVSLYLSENLRTRRERVTETNSFLTSEADKLSERVRELAARLADFKTQHIGSLPDEANLTWQTLDRAQRDLADINRRIEELTDRMTFARSELAATDPYGGSIGGDAPLSPAEQLRVSETQLATLRATYGDNYPDVVKLERQVEGLRAAVGGGESRGALEQQLRALEQQKVVLSQRYSDAHPDVVKLSRRIEEMKKAIADAQDAPTPATDNRPQPTNPAYLRLRAQVQAYSGQLDALQKQGETVRRRVEHYANLTAQAPEVERQYDSLMRNYNDAVAQLQAIKAKQTQAELATTVEVEQKGERFTILEPPALPQVPVSPNRLAIIAIGIVLGLGAGAGLGLFLESVDGRIHGVRQLSLAVGTAPLVAIPVILTETDRRRSRLRAASVGAAAMLGSTAILLIVHSFVMPLDVLWAVVERRFIIM